MGVKEGKNTLTPAMQQYTKIKEQYADCLLLFRMGDFYELFFEDAVLAAPILDIALTTRDKGKEDSVPLCGFPYHAAASYINKLVEKGFKVALCEQVEDPRFAKGVVKREVVRVITAGLQIDPESLAPGENNFLAALNIIDGIIGLAFLDLSTGEFYISALKNWDALLCQFSSLQFRELLLPDSSWARRITLSFGGRFSFVEREFFDYQEAYSLMKEKFPDEEIRQYFDHNGATLTAAGALLRYVVKTQRILPSHLHRPTWYTPEDYLFLDEGAKQNLELFASLAGGKEGSLFALLNVTKTAMGQRRLRWWLNYPLKNVEKIRERLNAVKELKEQPLLREELRRLLAEIYDLERIAGRISLEAANGRDLVALKNSLFQLPAVKALMERFSSPLLCALASAIDPLENIASLLERALIENPPLTLKEGGLIKEGYDASLDELLSLIRDGKGWIAALEEKERKRTGISSLKIGFNNVFGYYIEVTKANVHLVPLDYIRKQTLVNGERYINEELKGYEEKVLQAEVLRKEREYDLFIDLRKRVSPFLSVIQRNADCLAQIDVLSALAAVAESNRYSCPQVEEGNEIVITDGRHPVVEKTEIEGGFVPNDTYLNASDHRLLIITGPNMAGKSTYLRQIALIVLMAQMGSFVPAKEARLGVVDKIFTRIGAADYLSKGQSTFMVEMREVSDILRHATPKSLIILDEVGRGTSTYDGLSIAWAVAEYLHDAPHLKGAHTLFATHYHELTDLAKLKEGVKNLNVAVKEVGDKIVFLRRIVPGSTNRSYGIHVAQLAGVPEEVLLRAKEILHNLEKGEFDVTGVPKFARGRKKTKVPPFQPRLFQDEEELIIEELKHLDIMQLTPLQALEQLYRWQKKLVRI